MASIPCHPAPGFGDLVPGMVAIRGLGELVSAAYPIPQNPLNPRQLNYPAYGEEIKYMPHISEILPSRFSTPSNPLISQLRAGMSGGMGGCCCGDGDGSKGAAPDDTGTAYVNGTAVMGGALGDVLGNVNWVTVAIALAGGYLIFGRHH
jgi:hypothetical protein